MQRQRGIYMGSTGSPNSWAPYGGYRDCSQGICNINCPQWCYIIFPPPPPANPYDDSGFNFSPLIIAVIGILASTFLLIFYYTIIAKYCKRRRYHQNHPSDDLEEGNISQLNQAQLQAHAGGLDEAIIKSIAVCKYKRGDGLVEGTECAVCLGEFQENESLRLLPKCSHAFHLPCIDTWLKSHSSCPLCRANVVSMNALFTPPRTAQSSSNLYISPLENHHQNDLILVVNEGERGHREEVVVELVNDVAPKMGETGLRRSASMDSFSSQGRLLVADILQISEGNIEDVEMQIHRLDSGTGSSRSMWGENSAENGGNEKGKSSTGWFSFTGNEKGKSSMVLN